MGQLGPAAMAFAAPEGGVLGRGPSCEVRLMDPAVSYHHAEVGLSQQGLFIRDLGSRHGILLNGRRITESPLLPDQAVRLAGYTLRFLVLEVDQAVTDELESLLLRLYNQAAMQSGAELARAWSQAAPKKAAAQRLLAWFLLARGDKAEAEEAVQRAVWLSPDHPGTWFAQGILAEQRGDLEEASKLIGRVLRAESGHEAAQKARTRLDRKREVYGKVAGLLGSRKGGGLNTPVQKAQLTVGQFRFRFTAGLHDGLVLVAYAALAQAAEQINHRLNASAQDVRVVIKDRLPQEKGLKAAARYNGEIELDAESLAKGDPNFLYVALAHEYVHLVVDRVTGGNCPRWLDEGLAQYLTQNQTPRDRRILDDARRQNALLPLEALKGDFAALELPALVDLAYSQSYSLVEYLSEKLDSGGMGRLLAAIKEGGGAEKALAGMRLTLSQIETGWLKWLN